MDDASRRPVVIRRYADALQAEVDRQLLESAGIPAQLLRDDAGGMLPALPGMDIRLVVPWGDAVRALACLEGTPEPERRGEDGEAAAG